MLCTMVLLSQTISGLLLQEALQIAKGIDADTIFKASNGLSVIGGLDYWNGLLEWTLTFFFYFPKS